MASDQTQPTAGEAWWRVKNKRNRIKRPISYASIQQWARDECEKEAAAILADADAIRAEMSPA